MIIINVTLHLQLFFRDGKNLMFLLQMVGEMVIALNYINLKKMNFTSKDPHLF